jgi:hypothetical protein
VEGFEDTVDEKFVGGVKIWLWKRWVVSEHPKLKFG